LFNYCKKNPTLLNQQPVSDPVELKNNDVLSIGGRSLRFQAGLIDV